MHVLIPIIILHISAVTKHLFYKDMSNLNILDEPKFSYYITFTTIGLIGNILIMAITVNRGLIKDGLWTYIICLAVSDSLVLITVFIYEFSFQKAYLGIDLTKSDFLCKLIPSCAIFIRISHYILGCMTWERFLIIYNPYRSPPTPKRAVIVVLIITVIIAGILFPVYFVFIHVAEIAIPVANITIKLCAVNEEYAEMYQKALNVDIFINLVFPIIMILSANIGIIIILIKRARNKSINRAVAKITSDIRVTYMLIFVSLFFILTVSPLALFMNVLWRLFYDSLQEGFNKHRDSIGYSIIVALNLFTYSGNLFLYLISGQRFRRETKLFFSGMARMCCNTTCSSKERIECSVSRDTSVQTISTGTA